MGLNGRRLVYENYNTEKVVDMLETIYKSIALLVKLLGNISINGLVYLMKDKVLNVHYFVELSSATLHARALPLARSLKKLRN